MMKCQEITQLASEGMDRKLGLMERAGMKLHMMMCQSCRNFEQQMTTIRTLSRAYAKQRNDPSDGADGSA